jgi:hypothetical protein
MKIDKKFRIKSVAIASTLALVGGPSALAVTDTINKEAWMGDSYAACMAEYPNELARQKLSGQKNDRCFIAFDLFKNSATKKPIDPNKTVHIDHGHNNFQKFVNDGSEDGKEQRYLAFAKLLENDGFNVQSIPDTLFSYSNTGGIITGTLKDVKILVIANPVHYSDSPSDNWVDPILNAYTPEEIIAIKAWVKDGGKLMLIADHYPFPGAVDQLAQSFGFFMDNGYHFDPNYNDVFLTKLLQNPLAQDIMRQKIKTTDPSPQGGTITIKKTGEVKPRTIKDDLVDVVRQVMVALGAEVNSLAFWSGTRPQSTADGYAYGDGWLSNHPIVRGSSAAESIPFVTSFTGQSFRYQPTGDATTEGWKCAPLMQLGEGTFNMLTTAQDAYFGIDMTDSENNLVTEALTNQKVPKYTAAYVPTANKAKSDSCASSYLQGAAIEDIGGVGKGKVVVFGEAAMFSAQIAADLRSQMGFNNTLAPFNQQFVLNTLRWLDGSLTSANANGQYSETLSPELKTSLQAAVEKTAVEKLTMVLYRKAKDANANDPMGYAAQHAAALVAKYKNTPCATDSNGAYACLTGAVLPKALSDEMDNLVAAAPKTAAAAYKESYDGAGSGGCSIGNGQRNDPTLPILAFLAAGWLWLKRRRAA